MYQGKFDKKIKQAAEPAPVKKSPSASVKRSRGPRLSGVIFYAVFFLGIFLFYAATYFGLLGLRNWLTRYEMAQPATKSEEVFEKLFSAPDWGALYDTAGIQDTAYESKDAFVSYMESTGGPNHATEFLGTYIYRQGIRQSHLGYAAALSVTLLVLAVIGALATNHANKGD